MRSGIPMWTALALALAASRWARAGEVLVEPEKSFVALPGGEGGVRLDDYYYDRTLGRLVVPAGRTGRVDFVDPETSEVQVLEGFAAPKDSTGPAAGGPTSADGGEGLVFITDRTDRKLYVVDGRRRQILAQAELASGPDYVRYVAPTREIWVTEPRDGRIEVFSLPVSSGESVAAPRHEAFIKSKGGEEFEALVVDAARGRAYSNQEDVTVAIDLSSRAVVAKWPNRCKSAEGLALDASRGFLFVACREGRAAVLDAGHEGRSLSDLAFGEGIDIIAFSPETSRLFLPGSRSADLAFVAVSNEGKLTLLGAVDTARGAHCVAADDAGRAWVCDGAGGRLIRVRDGLSSGLKTRY